MACTQSQSIDIFCRVIDNFGDAGVMWRLARAMQAEGFAVRLIIDEPDTLKYLAGCFEHCPTEKIGEPEGISVCLWKKDWDEGTCTLQCADVVIEGFACRLPPDYQSRMAQSKPKWFNIDYFSAEDWIEGCHLVPSIDPTSGLIKINYFPGVTPASGGLIIENDYEKDKAAFEKCRQKDDQTLNIFFFAYPYGPIDAIAQALNELDHPIELNISKSEAGSLLNSALDKLNAQGTRRTLLPFVAQKDFDPLLWQSDLAFVRGEDSAARAMIAGVPFLWHIYHQDDEVHMVKLRALQNRLKPYFKNKKLFDTWCELQEMMNQGRFDARCFKSLIEGIKDWRQATEAFAYDLRSMGSLSRKLSQIIKNG